MKKKKRLITSALPYVNNIPHLGNLIQVLSGDAFARYCRNAGYETFYSCGTDEYGTATETRALQQGISPRELCDRFYARHAAIYDWFQIQFDHFGRTSAPVHTQIVQEIFLELEKNGYIVERQTKQPFCETCNRFLADRFVKGTCPHCRYANARGDQCENCGKVLDPIDLKDPRCEICGQPPDFRDTKHLYIDLPKILPKLEQWKTQASVKGFWAHNAIAMTDSWIRDGLKERAITRDLSWGVPVPRKGYENKVFYVWFDAPIGYVSITAEKQPQSWQSWWRAPQETELFQFIGKDNIPFHTVVFPSSQLGSRDDWTMLHHMSSSEYLNYENGKFSKSRGIGVFGEDCQKTGIVSDIWRFYIYFMRPEKADSQFAWKGFQETINGELIGNFSNFINRTLAFCYKFYNGAVPKPEDGPLWERARALERQIIERFERAELRGALKTLLELSDLGNKAFQAGEPWRLREQDPPKAQALIGSLVYLARDLALLAEPFIPEASAKVLGFLQTKLDWSQLGRLEGLQKADQPEVLFKMLGDSEIELFKAQFSGTQQEREMQEEDKSPAPAPAKSFAETIDLRAARITSVERHPEAEKLYILQLDAGELGPRQIVSSIVPFYKEEELAGKTLVVVANLKKAKFRGVPSEGMLLAAGEGEGENEQCEVLFTDAPSGARFLPEGEEEKAAKSAIKIDDFFAFPLKTVNGAVQCGNRVLQAEGRVLRAEKLKNADVG